MKSWHVVGICGIGMSALAQFAAAMDIKVSGSDRALENPENLALKAMLQAQGIELFPQDGSRFAPGNPPVDAVIYSTAIEESNPDFAASCGIERIHRAAALRDLIVERSAAAGKVSVAVAGSCGKTSTTALIAEALCNLNGDAESINGGMIKAFAQNNYPGNYRPGSGALIFEADESDKSLLAFHPDYALVLNIGTDHYPKAELAEMFAAFVNQAQKGAVLQQEVYDLINKELRSDLTVRVFNTPVNYRSGNGVSSADFGDGVFRQLPSPGRHTAANVSAAWELLKLMQFAPEDALNAALNTHGVARRFDFKGRTAKGCAVYDDYAHNPEKVTNMIAAAQELCPDGRLWILFQPHGYGPLGFMQQELGRQLAAVLRSSDRFMLAEPYYAGGTSSFSPHASEVLENWKKLYPAAPLELWESRPAAQKLLQSQAAANDLILVMGARDNTLMDFARQLTGQA